ncbi:MAG: dienelactone hydrolase family protein [Planctomycetes bacterium]|nr:dienelactone hydrolase family protein [Planctomycetota bacterium]
MIGKTLVSCFVAAALCAPAPSQTALQTKSVRYELGGTTFESTIVFDGTVDGTRPGILMVPNWMGPSEASLVEAKHIAADGYLVMMVDMYGVDTRPTNADEAGAAAGKVRGDRALMRARAGKALDVFRAEGKALGLDATKVAAIGFCFGGGTVLELGRAGADVAAIVSFHGDLASPTLEKDAGRTKAKVLVCHGADDPYVPQQDVQRFVEAMRATDVDWQLVQYSGTVHSFTDPTAASDGARYNERSATRAFASMNALLRSLWSR